MSDSTFDKFVQLISILKELGIVSGCVALFVYLRNRILEKMKKRELMCFRIGGKYYEIIKVCNQLRAQANLVSADSPMRLKDLNQELGHFHDLVIDVPNSGGPTDIEIGEVRQVFGDKAAASVKKLGTLFVEIDNEWKEGDAWGFVNTSKVHLNAVAILYEWNKLVRIMAHKRWMRKQTVERDFFEKSEAL